MLKRACATHDKHRRYSGAARAGALILAIVGFLAGCATEEVEEPLDLGLFTTPEPERPPAGTEPTGEGAGVAPDEGPPVTAEFREADIRVALRALALQTNAQIVVASDVSATVTVSFADIPFERALRQTAFTAGVGLLEKDGVCYVMKKEAYDALQETIALQARTRPIAEIQPVLSGLVNADTVKIAVDARSNTLFVTAHPDLLADVRSHFAILDRQRDLQVGIEAKFVEVQLEDLHRLGVRWGGITDRGLVIRATDNGSGELRLGFIPNTSLEGRDDEVEIGTRAIAPGGVTDKDFQHLEITRIDLFLEALEKRGFIKILSSPRVTTLSGKDALMDITQTIRYISQVQSVQSSQGTVTFTASQAELVTGIQLKVTPFIGKDDRITMHIEPQVTDLIEFTTFEAGDLTLTLPQTQERKATVEVQVHDQATLVLGGLLQNRKFFSRTQIPLAGDVPWLGNFFAKEEFDQGQTELVIFLTANIIREARSEGTREQEKELWNRKSP